MSPPKIGVLIPSFNHAAFIERCLESIIADSCNDLEIAIRDDASSDTTVQVVEQFICNEKFRRVRVLLHVNKQNLGSVETLNRGIESTDWDWIVLCNSDDEFGTGRLQAIRDAIEVTPNSDWGFTGVEFVDVEGQKIRRESRRWQESLERSIRIWGSVEFSLLISNLATSTGNLFFHRSLWERLGGFHELRHVHDWDFALRAMTETSPMFLVDSIYRYRIHDRNTFSSIPESVSSKEVTEVYQRFRASMQSARSDCAPGPGNYPGLWELFCGRLDRSELL